MVLKFDELKGARMKKSMNASMVRKRYHNKHVDGSGNFGFTIRDLDKNCWDMHGAYNPDKVVRRLSFGDCSSLGVEMIRDREGFDYDHMSSLVKKAMYRDKAKGLEELILHADRPMKNALLIGGGLALLAFIIHMAKRPHG